MSLNVYDSPTFLGQKDKYLAGLSLPQLMILIAVAFTVFIFTLLLPFGFMFRLLIVVPVTGVSGVLLFGQIAGLTIPSYLFHAVSGIFSCPSYEEHQLLLLNGGPVWLEAQGGGGTKKRFGFLRRRKNQVTDSYAMEQQVSELHAEFDTKMVEGSVAVERMVRDSVRTLLRGS